MIRLINDGYLRGLGILRIKNRELLNITGHYDDLTQVSLGVNFECNYEQPIHIGFNFGSLSVYIQVLGIQFYDL